ncbi:glycosyltransferase [Conexibacter arvalis]|uniref:GT2 family glycosyltransferase/glycosyltransferase involved in cell wall biosynthesis n=1 Tax=Conexibacter arvalis TaxID=912552 RepID=A0A840I9C9_9ACTN|nr:GT2 family glycosyltransferase/glycosyltransferase involved in cell wall biosynthesis [Conexibacter arvalis]
MSRVTAVIPVKDGERYLAELLDALRREGVDELIVIDSGSSDRSLEIARAAGVEPLEIPPAEFGHGRTRNLGAERASGELIWFLTQDATPAPGALDAFRAALALDERIGVAYGPHLPRPETSPMIARELTEFFAGFAGPDGGPAIQRAGDPTFLSNVNACYRRACWEEVRFRDLPYSEDQAFGRDALSAGWLKAYVPDAAVLHAHDYGALEFMRRYFDEYRGLRETLGHVERFRPLEVLRWTGSQTTADLRWMAREGLPIAERARWAARSTVHHSGRRVFSALGSRAERVPKPLRRRLSLERRDDARTPSRPPRAPAALPAPRHVDASRAHEDYEAAARVLRDGPAALLDPVPGSAEREQLRIAMVVPPWQRGSGGHNILFQVMSRLERRGHVCSIWVSDLFGEMSDFWPGVLRRQINDWFAPFDGPVHYGFDDWHGADIVVATGWQTVHPTLLLEGCRARAYLVNDHEPEFFATSTESRLAADTYRYGMHCIAGSPWLRDLLTDIYGASADAFNYGVDHAIYRPLDVPRRRDTVVYYGRHSTPRRAVPIGLMALEELHRRRPDVRIVLFGDDVPPRTAFPYEHLGVLSQPQLATLFAEATVGLCLSLTNFSLMPKEMLACGLPCVELSGVSAESIFGDDGALELADLEPHALASGIERLLDDRELWERRARAGIEFAAAHSWDRATDEVELGLRHALAEREAALGVG